MSPNAPINQNALVGFFVIILGILGAFFAGILVARGNEMYLALGFAGGIGLLTALLLGRNYWMLIFATMGLSGSAAILPLPFSFSEMGTIATFGLMIPYIALKRVRFNPHWGWTDYLLIINFLYLVTVWVRNPAGVRIFETEIVGGRAYITILIAMMGYFVLRNAFPSDKFARIAPLVICASFLLHAGINIMTEHFPAVGRFIYPIYTGVDISDLVASTTSTENERLTSYGMLVYPLMMLLCAYYRPITLLSPTNLPGLAGFCLSLTAIALSGFRSTLFQLGGFMVVGTVLRKKWGDLLGLSAIGVVGVALIVIASNAGITVPYGFQRALSFLPVGLDNSAKSDADDSKEWRLEMWKDAWNSPEIINNKVLGDGFGFRQDVLRLIMRRLMTGEGVEGAKSYELHMLQGSFHSGPLSAIRFVGIVGLSLLLIWMIGTLVRSVTVLRKAQGTPAATWAMYTAIPLVYLPFGFIIIFGDYAQTLVMLIYATGVLNTLENYLRDRLRKEKPALPSSIRRSPVDPISGNA